MKPPSPAHRRSVAAGVLLLIVSTGATPCTTDAECSYNGVCSAGACVCFPQWGGAHCAALRLVPTRRDAGLQLANASAAWAHGVSSWGGQVLHDGGANSDGKYHMFAATFTAGCSVWGWLSNSIVTHATADAPEGPYRAADCAMHTCAPEAHEPSVARDPMSGDWVMWFTSSKAGPGGAPLPGGWRGGSCDCTSEAALNATCGIECPANCSANCATGCQAGHWDRAAGMPTWMSHAPGPGGPWSKPVLIKTPECDDGVDPLCLDSNFAALGNVPLGVGGAVLALGRQARYEASDWRNASTYRYENADGLMGEDPFVYIDVRNGNTSSRQGGGGGASNGGGSGGGGSGASTGVGVLHMLRHTGRNTTNATGNFGTHQWSVDGGMTWQAYGDVHAYGCEATYTDGSTECLIMRERPHLIMDGATGLPVALSTGAMRGPYRHPEWLNAQSFTHIQKLNQD